jgi:16S rRNA (adenine1518-N6/adenine1519-N6)-dimethyltransferase
MARSANIRQRKSLGQVFLTTDWPLRRMIEKLKDWKVTRVLEIGPGAGIFTKLLVQEGFHVTAIEKDNRFAEHMTQWASESAEKLPGSLTVVNEDILKYDLSQWVGAASGGTRTAVLGNIPYNISSPIVMRILPELPRIVGSLLMTQLEFTKRLAALPSNKDYGSLSVFAQLRADVSMEFSVARGCFKPIPKVDSAVVCMTNRKTSIEQDLLDKTEKVTRAAFNQRRKKLRNSVSQFLVEGAEENSPIDLTRRADTVSPREYLVLAEYLIS